MERMCVAPVTREDYCASRREYWRGVNRERGAEITESALSAMVEQDAEAVEAAGLVWRAVGDSLSPRPSEAAYRSASEKLAPAIDLFSELYEALSGEEKAVVERLVADKVLPNRKGVIVCPGHGLRFDARSGKQLVVPPKERHHA